MIVHCSLPKVSMKGKSEPVFITQRYGIQLIYILAYVPLVLPLLEVVASSKGHQMSVVGRGRVGDGASAADVRVAQLVGEALEFICREVVVVPQDVVVRGSTGALRWREGGEGEGGESEGGEREERGREERGREERGREGGREEREGGEREERGREERGGRRERDSGP